MKTAHVWSEMSKCRRLKVGAVIAKGDRIISVGYNGTPSGYDNCCEDTVDYVRCTKCGKELKSNKLTCDCGSNSVNIGYDLVTKGEVIHAELNSILFAAKNGISVDGCTMYVTHAPCISCSIAMASAGIKRIVFSENYRDKSGIDFLKDYGIEVIEMGMKND